MPGRLITFEGIDGSGTTTQARRLVEALSRSGVPVHLTQEPSSGPVGCLIRQILQGRLVSIGRTGPRPPGWAAMGLLFAADRLDHLECEVLPNIRDGFTVVSDRYLHSSLVYQSVTSGDSATLDWLVAVNAHAREPEAIVYLDIEPQVAHRRRIDRRMGDEIFDNPELQVRLATSYRKLLGDPAVRNVVKVDGAGTEDEVHAACLEGLRAIDVL